MLKRISLNFLLMVAAVLFLGNARLLAEDKIVAIVNNEIITQKDLDEFTNFMYLQLSAKYKDKEVQEKLKEMKPDLLDRLVEDRLILQKAKKDNIAIDESRVKAKIAEIRSHYLSEADFQSALAKQGLTQADIEARIREQLFIFSIIDTQVRNKIIISPKEVTDFYEQNQEEFIEPETKRVSSLVIKTEEVANRVLVAVKDNPDFEKISKEYSVELNNLGLVKRGQLIKEIEDVIFNLSMGSTSEPVKYNDAYYIFKVEEILAPKKYSLSEAQEAIYNRLYELKMQEKLIQWLTEFKAKSYVEIK